MAIAAILSGIAVGQLYAGSETLVTIDPTRSFQTVSGWEVTADLADNPADPEWAAYRGVLMDRAVQDIGINRIRLEIRSGAETRSDAISRFIQGGLSFDRWKTTRYDTQNDNADPLVMDPAGFNFDELDWHMQQTVLPMRDRLRAQGEELFLNLCYVSFSQGAHPHDDPEEYAEFILATYQHLDKTYGFVPDMLEVFLEPDLKANKWTGETLGRAMVATARRLKEAGYTPAFAAPSVTDMANTLSYAQGILAVPGAGDYWQELTYHRYRHPSPRTLELIAQFADLNGLRPAMLEWWFGKGTHEVLLEDLVVGNNTAWQGRALVGLMRPGGANEDGSTLRYPEDIRFNRMIFNNVRRGAVRIQGVSSDDRHVKPVVFRNPDGGIVVAMDVDAPSSIGLRTMPAGDYLVSYEMRDKGRVDPVPVSLGREGTIDLIMPGAGMVVVAPHQP